MIIKNPFCMPRLRPAAARKTSRRLTPMSLLDRFREAVFRLIMLSALSKPSNGGAATSFSAAASRSTDHYYYLNDPHHSEAVADCIEFIKKSATAADETRDSSGGGDYRPEATAEAEVVVPLPVM